MILRIGGFFAFSCTVYIATLTKWLNLCEGVFDGMYLFDEQPIVANKTLARELGLNEALVLQQINNWIEINKKSGKNYHDGKYWTYNSIRACIP